MKREFWLISPIVILIGYLAFRLYNQSQMLSVFPLDFTNDWSSYIAQLHFLKVCGFHNYCPYWFNGFTTFLLVPPGWFYFTLPIYNLTGNVLYASYFSLVLMVLIGFISVFLFGKLFKFTKIERFLFFTVLFANANFLGTYLRQGRITECFAVILLFILTFILIWYKDAKFDKKFLVVPCLLAAIILSNISVAVLSFIMVLSLFLIVSVRQKMILALSAIASLMMTAFWWIPFVQNYATSLGAHLEENFTGYLWAFSLNALFINLAMIFSTLFFIVVLAYCIKIKNINKKSILFFMPALITAILLLTGIISYIPIMKTIYPDVYFSLFLFLGLFLMIKSKIYLKPSVLIIIFAISLGSTALCHYHTPYFMQHTTAQKEVLDILPYVDKNFIILSQNPEIYSKSIYSYAPIYDNLTTPSGWHASIDFNLYKNTLLSRKYLEERACDDFSGILGELKVEEVVATEQFCTSLKYCGLKEKKQIESTCIFKLI